MNKALAMGIAFFGLIEGIHAQGFLGKLKQGAVDAAKTTVNETVNQQQNAQGSIAGGQKTAEAANDQRATEEEQQRKKRDEEWRQQQKEIADQRAEDQRLAEESHKKSRAEADAANAQKADQIQKEEERRKKQKEEAQLKQKEDVEKILGKLREGQITAEDAEKELQALELTWEDRKKKIGEATLARDKALVADTGKRRFPLPEMIKTPVRLYNDFESGMSLEWCEAKLKTDGVKIQTNNSNINFQTNGCDVVLVFKSLAQEALPVLIRCSIKLPANIRFEQVVEKYKKEIPDAKTSYTETAHKGSKERESLGGGVASEMDLSMLQKVNTVDSQLLKVVIELVTPVGKVHVIKGQSKTLLCEFMKDGTVTIPSGLGAEQAAAASMIKESLIRGTTAQIEDKAIAKILQDMQKEQKESEAKKQQQKDAEALAF